MPHVNLELAVGRSDAVKHELAAAIWAAARGGGVAAY